MLYLNQMVLWALMWSLTYQSASLDSVPPATNLEFYTCLHSIWYITVRIGTAVVGFRFA